MKRRILKHIWRQRGNLILGMPILIGAVGIFFPTAAMYLYDFEINILIGLFIIILVSIYYLSIRKKALHNILLLSHFNQISLYRNTDESKKLNLKFTLDGFFRNKVRAYLKQDVFNGEDESYKLFYNFWKLPNKNAYGYDANRDFKGYINTNENYILLSKIEYDYYNILRINKNNYYVPQKSMLRWLNSHRGLFELISALILSLALLFKKKLPTLYLGKEVKSEKFLIISQYELALFNFIS